jgi:hypothetical protein
VQIEKIENHNNFSKRSRSPIEMNNQDITLSRLQPHYTKEIYSAVCLMEHH